MVVGDVIGLVGQARAHATRRVHLRDQSAQALLGNGRQGWRPRGEFAPLKTGGGRLGEVGRLGVGERPGAAILRSDPLPGRLHQVAGGADRAVPVSGA